MIVADRYHHVGGTYGNIFGARLLPSLDLTQFRKSLSF
jgi:hypothetical protein